MNEYEEFDGFGNHCDERKLFSDFLEGDEFGCGIGYGHYDTAGNVDGSGSGKGCNNFDEVAYGDDDEDDNEDVY